MAPAHLSNCPSAGLGGPPPAPCHSPISALFFVCLVFILSFCACHAFSPNIQMSPLLCVFWLMPLLLQDAFPGAHAQNLCWP